MKKFFSEVIHRCTGPVDFQHQQRDDDRKRPIAECFEPRGLRQTDFLVAQGFPHHLVALLPACIRLNDKMTR